MLYVYLIFSQLLTIILTQVPLYMSSSLIGQQLLGIKFSDERSTYGHYLYGVLIIVVQWIAERWDNINKLLFGEPSHRVRQQLTLCAFLQ